jgi:hypothetical protein
MAAGTVRLEDGSVFRYGSGVGGAPRTEYIQDEQGNDFIVKTNVPAGTNVTFSARTTQGAADLLKGH